MKLTFRKCEVKDLSELESLVAEHAETVEPGLRIIASNLNLGRSSVALAGLDAARRPVLIAVGLTADDAMIFLDGRGVRVVPRVPRIGPAPPARW